MMMCEIELRYSTPLPVVSQYKYFLVLRPVQLLSRAFSMLGQGNWGWRFQEWSKVAAKTLKTRKNTEDKKFKLVEVSGTQGEHAEGKVSGMWSGKIFELMTLQKCFMSK